jgi:hypothetical protein
MLGKERTMIPATGFEMESFVYTYAQTWPNTSCGKYGNHLKDGLYTFSDQCHHLLFVGEVYYALNPSAYPWSTNEAGIGTLRPRLFSRRTSYLPTIGQKVRYNCRFDRQMYLLALWSNLFPFGRFPSSPLQGVCIAHAKYHMTAQQLLNTDQ